MGVIPKTGAWIRKREEFIRDLECADDIFHGEDFSSYAKRLATHDADQRAVIDTLNELVKAKEARCEKYQAEITRLREALRRLRNEVSGLVYLDEKSLRETFGNTNVSIVLLRLKEAEQALKEHP